MANGSTDNNLVNVTTPPIPEYLDYNTIRNDSIEYLGTLTGKIWTDYNEHDPGITILEMLCYAMLDLNYRTKFPVADIMSRDPNDTSRDNNFFTAANILGCNPLTITDYRRLLIDIPGVKNAWLEIDQKNNPRANGEDTGQPVPPLCTDGSIEFINGLYHVCVELDDGYEGQEKIVIADIKKALACYRNLCEDFIDISILCKFTLGVCADIELELNADPEKVYEAMISALENFFSPSPKFYKLKDLLDKPKCKHIEDIFAGRPYDLTQSHGFVDIDEFEQIKLKKEIHLSDVYNVLKVDGVKTVRQLRLQKCGKDEITHLSGWTIHIPENYVPDFSLSCSGFRFTQNNKSLQVDFKKFEQAFQLNFAANTKVLYQQSSSYLDAAIPKGTYHSDLGDYYSIQNEFPRVYGIASGGLPANATKLRQAQALQLKGYLLFFDQLLADYLVQLKNIRELFSFASPGNRAQSHTYFLNQLNSVPDLNRLLRFSVDDSGQTMFGEAGSILGVPVIPKNGKEITFPAIHDPSIIVDPAQLQDYSLDSPAARDVAIQQLMNDISNHNFQAAIFSTPDGCYFIYLAVSDFAVMSKIFFKKLNDANQALSNIQYLASFKENYRSFVTAENKFSFDIEFNAAGYVNYLQVILENKSTYRLRREAFLNHLLSRFAEKFTDFALLSYGFLKGNKLTDAEIKNKESFLTNYPDLSSNRGKAYNYQADGWDVDNISGFEKRFKALTGIENWKRHSLCNFEVLRCDRHYAIQLKFAGFNFFSSDFVYDEKEEAMHGAVSLFEAASDYNLYDVVPIAHEDSYHIKIKYGKNRYANYIRPIGDQQSAWEIAKNIYRIFSGKALDEDVFVSAVVYRQELENYDEKIIRISKGFFETGHEALKSFAKSFKTINDKEKWEFAHGHEHHIGKLHIAKNDDIFMDLRAFKIDINNSIIGKPDIFTYEVLDINNNFKFVSAKEFKSEAGARTDSYHLLALMADITNYSVVMDKRNELWKIYILNHESIQAECATLFNSEPIATRFKNEIFEIARKHKYILRVKEYPHHWKFRFLLGYESNHRLLFQSRDKYKSREQALEAAAIFTDGIAEIRAEKEKGKLILRNEKNQAAAVCEWLNDSVEYEKEELPVKKANSLLSLRKKIAQQSEAPKPGNFKECISIDEANKEGEYIYRLVDKDKLFAKSGHEVATEPEAKGLRNALFNHFEKGYEFLEICLGGDVVIARADKTGVWYHYVIKCRKKILNLEEESIIFESYTGYGSEQEAEDAFGQDYLLILNKALDKNNYGSGKFISIEETFSEQHDHYTKSNTTVVVPKKTYQLLGAYDDEVIRELIRLASSYPVRMVQQPPAVTANTQLVKTNCKKIIPSFVYSFVLFNIHENRLDWKSSLTYNSPDEARQEFYFFFQLLKYKENYFIDFDYSDCKFVVYIREVLAESNRRFKDEKEAWGEQGVEKFICVAQTCHSFHSFYNRQQCCDSFYVACDNAGIIHPCTYESAEKRNQVLEHLYQTGKEFIQKNPPELFFPHNSDIIRDLEGKELAIFLKQDTKTNFTNYCNRLIELIDCILDDTKYKQDEDGFFLAGGSSHSKEKIAIPVDKDICLQEWKDRLVKLAYYFPIVKNTDANKKETFCVEIRFPCFNHPCNDLSNDEPCGCNGKTHENEDDCQLAWKSTCCFDTCREALKFYYKILPLLLNYQNYRAMYDCKCGPFRIELCTNQDIIAHNPQCYQTPDMNCEAIERSKKLLNAEGLHLVEHILLRPQCEEDYACDFYKTHCGDNTHCHFTWEIPGKQDPCHGQKNICFVPGTDPYSFIATVALPAWPARFRKKENRQLLEDILHREAPAHVLIRILWLDPHDLCCFETHFKKWSHWLGQKNICNETNPACEFLNFLFERNLECLEDCSDCLPCKTAVAPPSPCEFQSNPPAKAIDDYEILNQINELFCWKTVNCNETKKGIEQTPQKEKEKHSGHEPEAIILENEIAIEKRNPREQFIIGRLSAYEDRIGWLFFESGKNEMVSKASEFLSNQNPSHDQYSKLISLVLENKTNKSKKIKGLNIAHKKELISHLTRHYLDQLVFIQNNIEQLNELKTFFEQLRKKKINTAAIYDEWEAEEVKKYESGLNTKIIESIMGIK